MEPTEKDLTDQNSVKEALYREVMQVAGNQMECTSLRLKEKGFSGTFDTGIFDFLRVSEPDDMGDGKFLMMLYAIGRANFYELRNQYSQGLDIFYPIDLDKELVRKVYRDDLENGKIPKRSVHQISEIIDTDANCYHNHYETLHPLCVANIYLEVTNNEYIGEIEKLVGMAVNLGIRDEIYLVESDNVQENLGRIMTVSN